jgi:hypothetical protein
MYCISENALTTTFVVLVEDVFVFLMLASQDVIQKTISELSRYSLRLYHIATEQKCVWGHCSSARTTLKPSNCDSAIASRKTLS